MAVPSPSEPPAEHAFQKALAWRRVAAEGAAGTIYVTYRNDASGHQLIIGVSDVALSQGDAHAAYTIRYH